jgi:hypothetical protein
LSDISDVEQPTYDVINPSRDVIVTAADVHAPDYVTTESLFGGKTSPAEKTPTNDAGDVFEEDFYGSASCFLITWAKTKNVLSNELYL